MSRYWLLGVFAVVVAAAVLATIGGGLWLAGTSAPPPLVIAWSHDRQQPEVQYRLCTANGARPYCEYLLDVTQVGPTDFEARLPPERFAGRTVWLEACLPGGRACSSATNLLDIPPQPPGRPAMVPR